MDLNKKDLKQFNETGTVVPNVIIATNKISEEIIKDPAINERLIIMKY